jgi:hypothetical protein
MLIFSSRQVWDGNVLVTDNYDQITIKWGQVCSTKKYNGQLGCCFKFITNRPVLGWAGWVQSCKQLIRHAELNLNRVCKPLPYNCERALTYCAQSPIQINNSILTHACNYVGYI